MAKSVKTNGEINQNLLKQEYTSRNTSVNSTKVPAVFGMVERTAGGWKNELEDYLESIPQRAVMFNEFEYAVMPDSAKETAGLNEMLQRNGIKPIFHDGTEEGRKAALAGLVNDSKVSFSMTHEMHALKKVAEKNGTFTRAPNGEPTNLTELQWLQVRTS